MSWASPGRAWFDYRGESQPWVKSDEGQNPAPFLAVYRRDGNRERITAP
jgi:hypothetical protein